LRDFDITKKFFHNLFVQYLVVKPWWYKIMIFTLIDVAFFAKF